jgi:hypothetical protein
MSKNDITGDSIRTKGILSEEGEQNWDRIFGKKKKQEIDEYPENGVITEDEEPSGLEW